MLAKPAGMAVTCPLNLMSIGAPVTIWFDPFLDFKEHMKIRSIKALATFNRMDRLANLENGLTANSLR
jgi:hypothetical protein